jgi:hypothetical protein
MLKLVSIAIGDIRHAIEMVKISPPWKGGKP